jgi:DNA-binding FrmR family transcriptional regulator
LNEDHHDCANVLQTIAACRGAINGLMAQVIEGHIRFHLLDPKQRPTLVQSKAAQELVNVLNSYLK